MPKFPQRSSNKGFTLVEMLVVIVILAILAVIGVVIFTGVTKGAKENKKKADVVEIVKALESNYNPVAGAYPNYADVATDILFADGVKPKTPEGLNYNVIYNAGYSAFRVCTGLNNKAPADCSAPDQADCFCKDSAQVRYIAAATPTPAPTPTSPPTNPKKVFVTANPVFNGDLVTAAVNLELSPSDGLDAADKICKYRADLQVALTGKSWKAWLGTSIVSAASRQNQVGAPYELVDATGTDIAGSWSDLTDGTLAAAISVNEAGTSVTGNAWTNATTTGGIPASGADCGGWISADSATNGRVGQATSTTTTWTAGSSVACSSTFRLYCFEQ